MLEYKPLQQQFVNQHYPPQARCCVLFLNAMLLRSWFVSASAIKMSSRHFVSAWWSKCAFSKTDYNHFPRIPAQYYIVFIMQQLLFYLEIRINIFECHSTVEHLLQLKSHKHIMLSYLQFLLYRPYWTTSAEIPPPS